MIDENELLKNLELYLNQTSLGEVTVQTELSVGEICSLIKDCPTIDAEPVQYGKWISDCLRNYGQTLKLDKDGCITNNICHCSECGKQLIGSDEYTVFGKYCPNCGVKMIVDDN